MTNRANLPPVVGGDRDDDDMVWLTDETSRGQLTAPIGSGENGKKLDALRRQLEEQSEWRNADQSHDAEKSQDRDARTARAIGDKAVTQAIQRVGVTGLSVKHDQSDVAVEADEYILPPMSLGEPNDFTMATINAGSVGKNMRRQAEQTTLERMGYRRGSDVPAEGLVKYSQGVQQELAQLTKIHDTYIPKHMKPARGEGAEAEQGRDVPVRITSIPLSGASETASETTPDRADKPVVKAVDGYDPMAAVIIDRSQATEARALRMAQERLDEELQIHSEDMNGDKVKFTARVANQVARMWKGNILRGYYEQKYKREYLDAIDNQHETLATTVTENGQERPMTAAEMREKAKSDATFALIMRMTNDHDEYVQRRAGEKRELMDKDSDEYKGIANAIRGLASGDWNEEAFRAEIERINAEHHGDQAQTLDNYQAIALYVKGQLENLEGTENLDKLRAEKLDEVMADFKIYSAESREGVRSEVHRNAVESAVDKLAKSPVGQVVPPEIMAAVAGVAVQAATSLSRSAAVLTGGLAGSMAVTATVSAIREGDRAKNDRVALMREMAEGGDIQQLESKYGRKVAETVTAYEMKGAAELLKWAQRVHGERPDNNNSNSKIAQTKSVLTDLMVRQVISDTRQVDLISYSSPDSVESERLALVDIQLQLQADLINLIGQNEYRKFIDSVTNAIEGNDQLNYDTLSSKEQADVESSKNHVRNIEEKMRSADKAFNKLRRRRMAKAAAASAAMSGLVSLGVQEISAISNPNLQGAVERLMGHDDGAGANQTALEGLRSFISNQLNPGEATATGIVGQAVGETTNYDLNNLDANQVQQLRDQGFEVTERTAMVDQTQTGSVSVEEAVQNNASVHRAGWFNNGTNASDFNELVGHHSGNSYTFSPAGGASDAFGGSVGHDQIMQMADNGQIKLWLSPTKGTQGNPFEIIGHVENGQIVFDPEPGSPAAELLANRNYAYAEVVDANNMVMATEVGPGTASSLTVTKTVPVETVVGYDVTATEQAVAAAQSTINGQIEVPFGIPIPFMRSPLARPRTVEQSDSTDDSDNGDSEPTPPVAPVPPSPEATAGGAAAGEGQGDGTGESASDESGGSGGESQPDANHERGERSELERAVIDRVGRALSSYLKLGGPEQLNQAIANFNLSGLVRLTGNDTVELTDQGQRLVAERAKSYDEAIDKYSQQYMDKLTGKGWPEAALRFGAEYKGNLLFLQSITQAETDSNQS